MEIAVTATNINAVTNHPLVRPFLGGDGESYVDMTAVVTHDRVITCDFGDGYLVFHNLGHCWEVHTAFKPEAHGYRAYNCAREAIGYMYTNHNMQKLKAKPPVHDKRTARFCRLLGFERCGSARIGGDIPYDANVFMMTRKSWFSCLPL